MNVPSDPTDLHFVLLAGGVQQSPLATLTGMSVIDLLVDSTGNTVLDHWLKLFEAVSQTARIIVAGVEASPSPGGQSGTADDKELRHSNVEFRVDRNDYRGAAGALRDHTDDLKGSDTVVVAEAARLARGSLSPLLMVHEQSGADVTVGLNSDHTPNGLYVASRAAITYAKREGYVDLKEQWLLKLQEQRLRIMTCCDPGLTTWPLRTSTQYLDALQQFAADDHTDKREIEPSYRMSFVSEPVRRSRSVIHPTARVDSSALIMDSVIMANSVTPRGAVIVRSIVGQGAEISIDSHLVDQVLCASSSLRSSTRQPDGAGGENGWQSTINGFKRGGIRQTDDQARNTDPGRSGAT